MTSSQACNVCKGIDNNNKAGVRLCQYPFTSQRYSLSMKGFWLTSASLINSMSCSLRNSNERSFIPSAVAANFYNKGKLSQSHKHNTHFYTGTTWVTFNIITTFDQHAMLWLPRVLVINNIWETVNN